MATGTATEVQRNAGQPREDCPGPLAALALRRPVAAGRAWVGDNATLASDGKTWVSQDMLRQFRPPSYEPNLDLWQANFEWRLVPGGSWFGNGHLDVTDLP
jgi:hypothetical protein